MEYNSKSLLFKNSRHTQQSRIKYGNTLVHIILCAYRCA